MSSHRVAPARGLARLVPFSFRLVKPQNLRQMGRLLGGDRDDFRYAWKVLTQGVCDGCAVGSSGWQDWASAGPHLCLERLELLRLNTMPVLEPALLDDVEALRKLDDRQLRALGRLPFPMLREAGARGFSQLTWDEALARIAARLRGVDPRRLAFLLTPRGLTNEGFYVAQKVARFLGTNHIDGTARAGDLPGRAAMQQTLGVTDSTCGYRDWYGTDLVVFFGSNPATDHPVSVRYLHEARKLGTKVVLVNAEAGPGDGAGGEIADYRFAGSPAGEIALLYGVCKILFAEGWIDRPFLKDHARGAAVLRRQAESYDWPEIEQQSGLARASIHELAALLGEAQSAVLVWSTGAFPPVRGGEGVQMILNLALLRGWIGRDQCGVMPISVLTSSTGSAAMGAEATTLPGGRSITAENCAALAAQYGFPIPAEPGLNAREMLEAAARGELEVLYCLGGNFLEAQSEVADAAGALENVPLRVHQDLVLTGQMLFDARGEVILLPAKTRYEQDGGATQTSPERRVMFSPELPRQVGEARAEWRILLDLAAAVDPERAHLLGAADGAALRAEMARVVPLYDGVQHLEKTGDAFQFGGAHLCPHGQFPTEDGFAHLAAPELPPRAPAAESDHRFIPEPPAGHALPQVSTARP